MVHYQKDQDDLAKFNSDYKLIENFDLIEKNFKNESFKNDTKL